MKVYVLAISHKHGTDFYVGATRAALQGCLDDYVDYWWQKELPEVEKPADPEKAAEEYFERLGDRESYVVDGPLPVRGSFKKGGAR